MTVIYILIFVSVLIASGFLVGFIWAVKSGQYDDTYTPSVRILFDKKPNKKEEYTKEKT
ncbi:MAG: cbb3-type cytochrome oxidase assembly protein CcoS [Cyclobacteriaceae bacterium]|nr:cbb3-type cytochrome oxidase assembly protein CcoS [Cyclobacteriaceae bacterium]